MPPAPALVHVLRGGLVESVHRAHIVVSDAAGRLRAAAGDPGLVTYIRSAAKPFQALPLVETGAADAFRVTPEELALVAGSHNGEPRQVELVAALLARAGLSADALQCGAHAPYGAAAAKAVGDAFTSLHHNCSGKHAGFLLACVHNGWDPATYLERDHPVQVAARRAMADAAGMDPSDVSVGIDGCSAPNFALPLRAMARAAARLAAASDGSLARVRNAMVAYPEMVAGAGRTDTTFMRACRGNVWIKAGAEACYAGGVIDQGLGFVVKVEDGSNRPIPRLLYRALERLGAVDEAARRSLAGVWDAPVTNWRGLPVGGLDDDVPWTDQSSASAV